MHKSQPCRPRTDRLPYDRIVREPTLKDVAEAAGVHAATASRALNPQTRGAVAEATARKVIAVAESLGYRGNPIARSLKTSRSGTVGLLIPDLTHPLYPPIIRGLRKRSTLMDTACGSQAPMADPSESNGSWTRCARGRSRV